MGGVLSRLLHQDKTGIWFTKRTQAGDNVGSSCNGSKLQPGNEKRASASSLPGYPGALDWTQWPQVQPLPFSKRTSLISSLAKQGTGLEALYHPAGGSSGKNFVSKATSERGAPQLPQGDVHGTPNFPSALHSPPPLYTLSEVPDGFILYTTQDLPVSFPLASGLCFSYLSKTAQA